MTGLEAVGILLAGLAAGAINAVVGSGTLVAFPTLIALGYPPVVATMSNTIGLVPGNLSSAWVYRRELAGQRALLLMLAPASLVGAVIGAWLLLHLPDRTFRSIVPALIVLALVLVLAQSRIQRAVAVRRGAGGPRGAGLGPIGRSALVACVFVSGVYGGYFAAAQGILILGLLGLFLNEQLQRINAMKVVLVGLVNALAAVSYTVVAFDRIEWPVAGLIALGALLGGNLGARYGRRLSPRALRSVIVVLGLVAIWRILS